MSREDIDAKRMTFARAYFTPGPTFQNGTESYMAAFPEATRESARRSSSKLLKTPQVRAYAEELRKAAFVQGALTLDEFVKWGWETLGELRHMSKLDPKYSTAIPNLYDRVGKAAGFMVQRVEDMTPPERRLPMGSAELIASTRDALERMERLNAPNPMPLIAAPTDRKATEDADYEIADASSTNDSDADDANDDNGTQATEAEAQ